MGQGGGRAVLDYPEQLGQQLGRGRIHAARAGIRPVWDYAEPHGAVPVQGVQHDALRETQAVAAEPASDSAAAAAASTAPIVPSHREFASVHLPLHGSHLLLGTMY